MKIILFVFSLVLAISNSCNQNKESKPAKNDNANNSNIRNSDSIKKIINSQVLVNSTQSEHIKSEESSLNNLSTQSEFFSLLTAISQNWKAGIQGGGSGTEYYFKIKINTQEAIKFDSAWINNKGFEIFIAKESAAISNEAIKFGKEDTITLRISNINSKIRPSENVKPAITFDGAALIRYAIRNKHHYFIIKEISKEQTTNRP